MRVTGRELPGKRFLEKIIFSLDKKYRMALMKRMPQTKKTASALICVHPCHLWFVLGIYRCKKFPGD
jgi:hypothetical protein